MKKLPQAFLERMQLLLGDEYDDFLKSYEKPAQKGIRLNLKKMEQLRSSEYAVTYEKLTDQWGLQPLPNSTEYGKQYREFILNEDLLEQLGIRAGKHPYHEAGLYYLQEPSAMQVVEHLGIRPFDRVLDLCAAPGGKSTQAADMLDPDKGGLIVANEYVSKRAQILSSNFERMGISCGIVMNEDSARLADRFPEYFTRIIVDAPCSGEGMFRKDDTAIAEWSLQNVELCVRRQKEILKNAVKMLSHGGMMSYSTCTFETCENEEMVEWLLQEYPDLELMHMKRLWPHKTDGEGHFLAIFRRAGQENTIEIPTGMNIEKKGDHTVQVWNHFPSVKGLKVLRCGVDLGIQLKNRFEPGHAYAHAADLREITAVLDLKLSDPRVDQYLHGMQLILNEDEMDLSGWVIVAVDGAALGMGKAVNGQLKNHFPKGLRWM